MTAQVVTITPTLALPEGWQDQGILKVSWDWLSTDAGVVAGSVTPYKVKGILGWFEAIPDPTTTTPTAAYTFTVKDEDGVDILHGLGVGSSTATATVTKVFGDGLGGIDGTLSTLTLAVAGAGNAKGGILNLYFLV